MPHFSLNPINLIFASKSIYSRKCITLLKEVRKQKTITNSENYVESEIKGLFIEWR